MHDDSTTRESTTQAPLAIALSATSAIAGVLFVCALVVSIAGVAGATSVRVPGGLFALGALLVCWLSGGVASAFVTATGGAR